MFHKLTSGKPRGKKRRGQKNFNFFLQHQFPAARRILLQEALERKGMYTGRHTSHHRFLWFRVSPAHASVSHTRRKRKRSWFFLTEIDLRYATASSLFSPGPTVFLFLPLPIDQTFFFSWTQKKKSRHRLLRHTQPSPPKGSNRSRRAPCHFPSTFFFA